MKDTNRSFWLSPNGLAAIGLLTAVHEHDEYVPEALVW